MSRFLLDTSAYAAFCRDYGDAKAAVREASELCMSPIVLGELRAGFLKGTRRAANERSLERFLASPRCNVLVIDEETAHRYALIHDYLRRAGTPVSGATWTKTPSCRSKSRASAATSAASGSSSGCEQARPFRSSSHVNEKRRMW